MTDQDTPEPTVHQTAASVPVTFSGISEITRKYTYAHVNALVELLMSEEGIHDFAQQHFLLREVQSGVRTMDVLSGSVDINGEGASSQAARALQVQSHTALFDSLANGPFVAVYPVYAKRAAPAPAKPQPGAATQPAAPPAGVGASLTASMGTTAQTGAEVITPAAADENAPVDGDDPEAIAEKALTDPLPPGGDPDFPANPPAPEKNGLTSS